jgi:hypothetical protein
LRVNRQQKLAESGKVLRELQEELKMEDEKFKEVVKEAGDVSKKTEVFVL